MAGRVASEVCRLCVWQRQLRMQALVCGSTLASRLRCSPVRAQALQFVQCIMLLLSRQTSTAAEFEQDMSRKV
jgi:hypothetical protein